MLGAKTRRKNKGMGGDHVKRNAGPLPLPGSWRHLQSIEEKLHIVLTPSNTIPRV